MRVDIFKREEASGIYSYLLIPEGKNIPGEATNTDWELDAKGVDINVDEESLDDFSIVYPAIQIRDKGYAISNLSSLSSPSN